MEHSSHQHTLMLNENYIAGEGDVCRGCNYQIVSCKSFVYSCSGIPSTDASVEENVRIEFLIRRLIDAGNSEDYVCAKFLLHKTCAELPAFISNPTNPKEFLKICFNYSERDIEIIIGFRSSARGRLYHHRCCICGIPIPWKVKVFFYSGTNIYVCLNCAMFQFQSLEDPKFKHPAHNQHQLALIQQPSSFKCYACRVDDNIRDMSYRCTECQFWMHKSCSDAPTSFRFQFHNKHPLILSFTLPQVYHKFDQYCRLCDETLSQINWIYYCPKCRIFAHFQCARSTRMLSSSENEDDDSDLVHLPAADEASVNLLGEQFIKAMSTWRNNGNSIISPTSIKHWAHDEHPLLLITISELFDQRKFDVEMLLLCDGCVKPIRTDDNQFYGCVPCKYFLHKFCAEFPKDIEHHLWPGMTFHAAKYSKPYMFFQCESCGASCNGIFFRENAFFRGAKLTTYMRPLHIGCAALPKMIKHDAHPHKLNQLFYSDIYQYKPNKVDRERRDCKACGEFFSRCKYGCEQCDFYICGGCITKASTVKHPWDPHPLHLIYESGMAEDHEHDFNCEFCSEDIDTNFWFYHCDGCDLSFHLKCLGKSCYLFYSNIKFGATDIIIDKLHPHSLTFVLNKKVRACEKCNRKQLGSPVLECAAPCKAIFCRGCIPSSAKKFNDVLH